MYLVKQHFTHQGEDYSGYAFYNQSEWSDFLEVFNEIWRKGKTLNLYREISKHNYVNIEFDRKTYLESVETVLLSENIYKTIIEFMPSHAGTTFVGNLYDSAREQLAQLED